jgi:hypothetical protein
LDLGRSESLDGCHGPTALGAEPEIPCSGYGSFLLGLWCGTEQLKTEWQGRGTPAMGQEAEMPDAHETFREDVQQEATQELIKR